MVSRGRKTAADAARLFKVRLAAVSQLLARQSEAVPTVEYAEEGKNRRIKEREPPEKFATQDQNEEISMRFMNDSTFREVVSTWLAREAFRRLGQPATVGTNLDR